MNEIDKTNDPYEDLTNMELNYNEAYWDSVAYNQWLLKLMMELTEDDE